MQEFIAIDFETANPKRVSACAIGYAKVSNCEVVESKGYLIKPIGGHAPFQSKIHGIKDEHTFDKPDFGELFPEIREIFDHSLVAHSLFDKQVLCALSDHFGLGLCFNYIDSCSKAKEQLPGLKCYKLKSLVKYFDLPPFKHHDAMEDAIACAKIFLKLHEQTEKLIPDVSSNEDREFKGLILGILADDDVNYKEAYQLLYWLEDHVKIANQYQGLFSKTKKILSDDFLDINEAQDLKILLKDILESINKE